MENSPIFMRQTKLIALSFFFSSFLSFGQSRLFIPSSKGHGNIALQTSYAVHPWLADASAQFRKTQRDGSQELYREARLDLWGEYGLTDRLSAALNLPFVYRQETKSFKLSTWGIGDVTSHISYKIFHSAEHFSMYGSVYGKFPTGQTNSDFDATQGITQLPLGKGVSEISPALRLQESMRSFTWMQELSYTFSFENTVSFAYTDAVLSQSTSQGTVFLTPAGNLKMDWGDTLRLRTHNAWKSSSTLSFFINSDFSYRRPTFIEDFAYTQQGTSLNSQISQIQLPSSYLLSFAMGAVFDLNPNWKILTELASPLWGKNTPIQALSYVESRLGPQLSLEARYAF